MANFFVYLVIGGSAGWIACLIAQTRAQQAVMINILLGIVGSYGAAWALTGETINRDLDAASVLGAVCGATLLLALYALIRARTSR